MATLSFDQGTLLLEALDQSGHEGRMMPPGFIWDERVGGWRSEGFRYRDIVLWLRRRKIQFTDRARRYDPKKLCLKPIAALQLFNYQLQAVLAWQRSDQRGVVVLPTGAGKTVVALEAIYVAQRPTLIVAPTLDLLNQWHDRLTDAFDIKIGIVGQGVCEIEDVTVITYHSAYRRIGEIGGRFGLIVFDEVHHLTAPEWAEIARMAIAPFRLGLTATYDPRQSDSLNELLGPLVYWKPMRELSGTRLAPYEVVRLSVDLSPEERLAYEREETIYLSYWRGHSDHQIESRLDTLLREQARDAHARGALQAWYQMRRIIAGAEAKIDTLEELFRRHASDRVIVFTATNEVAYRVSQLFLIPAITHQTNARERKTILQRFGEGQYKSVVTSRVLNEGVDVPEAAVAIILGGSGSTREHTQRLGRILRQRANKLAVLYEITARGTMETGVSRRRRQTEAYAGRAKKISRP
ncbi:MAG TPA: DEAD/DEAH box helicase family protein [Blastocatellia bacterium]|nr:DEAD/DEAH box helicase family protein [Blastocatellia bacterium]